MEPVLMGKPEKGSARKWGKKISKSLEFFAAVNGRIRDWYLQTKGDRLPYSVLPEKYKKQMDNREIASTERAAGTRKTAK